MTSAMLECTHCRRRKSQLLSEQQLNGLHSTGCSLFYCDACRNNTFWCYADYDRRSTRDRRVGVPDPNAELESAMRQRPLNGRIPGLEPLGGDLRPEAAHPAPVTGARSSDRRTQPQRDYRRIALGLPVRVRAGRPEFEERTTTVNVCKGGIYISTEKPFQKDMNCHVVLNYAQSELGNGMEQKARVVRIDVHPLRPQKGVAIAFEN
jgi:hypothetical protein